MWIDTHCHLDAPEFGDGHALALQARALAAERGVSRCVIPAVAVWNFDTVRALAHHTGDAYALGIHPLYVDRADDGDIDRLDQVLTDHRDDPRLVAVGEIGLDFFVPALCEEPLRTRQQHFYREQLRLARRHGLPVILHVRRSADLLLQQLRRIEVAGGIAHAFNGSEAQARAFTDRGFVLGFGGAMTFDTARQLRRLAATLPLESLVLETDAPDIPPHWLYVNAARRAGGEAQGINTPAELPRIGAALADLRGLPPHEVARTTSINAQRVLPRLAGVPRA